MDWSVVPISALVSAAVALTVRWLDKPRPHLVATSRGVMVPVGTSEAMRDALGAPVTVTNYGSGPAFDLRVAGSGCVAGIRQPKSHAFGSESWDDRLPVLPAGETIVLDVQGWTPNGPNAFIVLTHPRVQAIRWLRRTYVWSLADIPSENPFPPSVYEPRQIPWLRRRLGAVSRHGLRKRVAQLSQADEADSADSGT